MSDLSAALRAWETAMSDLSADLRASVMLETLRLIASFSGKTLIAPSLEEMDGDRAHQVGASKAFEQTAHLARAAIDKVERQ